MEIDTTTKPLNQNKMSKQTKKETIEEFVLKKYGPGYHSVDIRHAFIDGAEWMKEQAKKMEKEKIENAYWEGGQDVPVLGKQCEQYCNETFKSNNMRTFYVIKNFTSLKYISINDEWDDWNMCKEFETKQDAIDYGVENGLGLCVIEEVINF